MKKILIISLSTILFGCVGGNHGGLQSTPIPKSMDCPYQSAINSTGTVRVVDGDTIELIQSSGEKQKIRLLGIDAPEKSQEFGSQSTEALEACVNDAIVSVHWSEKDRYGRYLGKVFANNVDCNARQVQLGMAWHFKKYQSSQSEYDRAYYSNLEVFARMQKIGLWSSPKLLAPWDYRAGRETEQEFNEVITPTDNLQKCDLLEIK